MCIGEGQVPHRTGNFWHTSLSTQVHLRAKEESHHPEKQVVGCRKSIQDRKDSVQNREQTQEVHDWTWWISSTWCYHQLHIVQGQCPRVWKKFAGSYCNGSMWSDLVQWRSAYSAGAGGPGQLCPGVGKGFRWSQTGPWTSCVSTWCEPTPKYNEWWGWSTRPMEWFCVWIGSTRLRYRFLHRNLAWGKEKTLLDTIRPPHIFKWRWWTSGSWDLHISKLLQTNETYSCSCIFFTSELLFFFSTRLFDRRTFSSKDCFTGQSPGMSARTMLAIFIPAAPGCA